MSDRWAVSICMLFAIASGGCASAAPVGTDATTASSTVVAQATSTSDVSPTSAPGIVPTSPEPASTTSSTDGTPDTLPLQKSVFWDNPPLFVVPGTNLALSFRANETVGNKVAISTLDNSLGADAVLDTASGSWTATLLVPDDVAATELVLTAINETGEPLSDEIVVAVIGNQDPINAEQIEQTPEVFAELPWGSDDGQVGIDEGNVDVDETFLPQSLDVDPRDGSVVVLDSVNERLVVIGHDGIFKKAIPLPVPDQWYVQDVVVMGASGRAAAVAYPSAGEPRLGVFDVNLANSAVETGDSIAVPRFPNNVPMFWNPHSETVVARIAGQDFSFYRSDDSTFVQSLEGEEWFDSKRTDDPPTAGISDNGIDSVVAALPEPTIIDSRLTGDGTFWQIVGSIDFGVDPAETTTSLIRVRPGSHTALSVVIDFEYTASYSRRLTVLDDDAYVAVPSTNGYRIDRYRLSI